MEKPLQRQIENLGHAILALQTPPKRMKFPGPPPKQTRVYQHEIETAMHVAIREMGGEPTAPNWQLFIAKVIANIYADRGPSS